MTNPYASDACKMQIAGDFFVGSPLVAMADHEFEVSKVS